MRNESQVLNRLLGIATATCLLTVVMLIGSESRVRADEDCSLEGTEIGNDCAQNWVDYQFESCGQCAFTGCMAYLPDYWCINSCNGAAVNTGCS